MNNNFVQSYCDYYGLEIRPTKVKGENQILSKNKVIGFYREDSPNVEFDSEYAKSDLVHFLLEELPVHRQEND